MSNNKALVKATNSELQVTEKAVIEYGAHSTNLAQMLAEEMDGLNLSFERIKIPAGGGLAYDNGKIMCDDCAIAFYEEQDKKGDRE